MYFCRICGNVKHFTEFNVIETEVHFDEESGEVVSSCDSFVECTEVICGVCKATSNNGKVLTKEVGERV